MEPLQETPPSTALARQNALVGGINGILGKASAGTSLDQLRRFCLAVAEEVTGAAISFMGDVDPATGRLAALLAGKRGWQARAGGDPRDPSTAGFEVHGLDVRVVHGGRSLIANDLTAEPGRATGPAPFRSFLGIPFKHDGRTVGMIALGDRDGGFRVEDMEAGEALALVIFQALRSKRAEAALLESEERLRRFGEASQDVLWVRDADTLRLRYLTPAFETIYGLSRDQALEGDGRRSWFDLVLPEDRAGVARDIDRVRAGEWVTSEYRIRRPSDGVTCWVRSRHFPLVGETGKVTAIGGIGQDITAMKHAHHNEQALVAELQHRVRNILALTRSIVSRSNDGERSTEEYVQHLLGRIAALARAQAMLTRAPGAGVDLQDMLRDELLAQAAPEDMIVVDGPDVELPPKIAEVMTLAVHELATNATKFGAFSRPGGRLDVRWRVEDREGQDWLVLSWVERGVPILEAAPRRLGFGAELISRRIPYELRGHGRFDLRPGGLHSEIEFPLVVRGSILQWGAALRRPT